MANFRLPAPSLQMAGETCLFRIQRPSRDPVARSAEDSVVKRADVLESLGDLVGGRCPPLKSRTPIWSEIPLQVRSLATEICYAG